MTSLQILALKAVAALAILAAVVAGTWFKAEAYYGNKYAALLAEEKQHATDAQRAVDDKIRADTTVSKEVNDEAVAQIAALSNTVDRLVRERTTLTLRPVSSPAAKGPPGADDAAHGPAATGNPAETPQPAATVAACLDPGSLRDILDVADQTISELLLFREYARQTGQSP
jgi:hypothetical protein